jgi:hypothetical protein
MSHRGRRIDTGCIVSGIPVEPLTPDVLLRLTRSAGLPDVVATRPVDITSQAFRKAARTYIDLAPPDDHFREMFIIHLAKLEADSGSVSV